MRTRTAADRIQTLPVGENYDAPFRTERRRSGDQVRWRSWRGRRDPRIVVALGVILGTDTEFLALQKFGVCPQNYPRPASCRPLSNAPYERTGAATRNEYPSLR